MADAIIAHFGTIEFIDGGYRRTAGSVDWSAEPVAGFGLAIGPPLGQIRVSFREPMASPYTVLVTAVRLPTTPSLYANCGPSDASGFVVHLFDPIGSRTLQNGGLSFAVLTSRT